MKFSTKADRYDHGLHVYWFFIQLWWVVYA